ncbi:ethanolamine kinase 1 isoform X2 [Coccinella septempunctata]|uniref:ethanolamine kinase 1 isoform X2 n=1 Tax=Coccinella septempunctata TaxID=41139 RepID=UPI001D06049F|nr:ethanolamine kinase 1 isoform X2 [Coccinella septempunctata]
MELAPHFKINVVENALEDCIFQLIQHVRPKWDTARIKTKLMTDGITNKLVLCRNITDDGIEEHLLVRVYGHKTDLLIDRKAEIRNIQLLHQYGLAPSLYATFENGLVYEFIPGRTLSYEDVSNPKIYKMIAKEMAKMHKQFVDLVPDKFDDEIKQKAYEKQNFPKEQLLKEIREFREGVRDFDMDIVFAHNDLLLGNIIYNEAKNKVFFIDYEYASYNYQPFDIANHFTEFAGVSEIDYSRFPQKDLQMDWLKTYLLEYKGVTAVSDRDVETLYIQVNKFVLAAHLFWYSWSLIQAAHSHIDFDFIGYAANRIEDYFKRKPEISAL